MKESHINTQAKMQESNIAQRVSAVDPQKEKQRAHAEANKIASQGRKVARQAIKMVGNGESEDRAKLSVLPNAISHRSVDESVVTMAANAELKSQGQAVSVDVYEHTPVFTDEWGHPLPHMRSRKLNVAVKSVDGVESPKSDDYLANSDPKAWRAEVDARIKDGHYGNPQDSGGL